MKKISLLVAAMLCGASVASAATEPWLADFQKADLNDSGGLSAKELEKTNSTQLKSIKTNFSAIDADRDGHVTPEEYRHYLAKPAASKASVQVPKDQCQPDCGVVVEVDRYKVEGSGSPLGAIAGGVAGGLLGNQVGGGTGKTVATVGGAAGGAYAGYQVEKRMKTKKMVKVTVKFDSGQQQDFEYEAAKSPFPRGARVQLKDGALTSYTGQ